MNDIEPDKLGHHKMMRLNAGQTEKINPKETTEVFPTFPAANVAAYQKGCATTSRPARCPTRQTTTPTSSRAPRPQGRR